MKPTFKLELTEDECSMLHFLVDEYRTVGVEPFDRTSNCLNEFAVGLKEDLKAFVEMVEFDRDKKNA
jgi:hypothetical protein